MHLTCTRSIQESNKQGSLDWRPRTHEGVTKGPNTNGHPRHPELKLRGQYHACIGITTTYVHARKGDFQYNNAVHPEQS
jgi:hypothetical protein